MDEYIEPADTEIAETKVKGSRFIARVFPVHGVEEVSDVLARLRKAEYDATHHCSSYRLGPEGELWRQNDDGEPNGTAGAPIFRQIESSGLTNVLVVVTRYYGGTKLGTGGLIRAYGDVAQQVLGAVRRKKRIQRIPITVGFAYDDTSPAMHTINQFDARIEGSEYGDSTRLTIAVRRSQASPFRDAMIEALSGRVVIEPPAE